MASASCKRCQEPVADGERPALVCPACGGPVEDDCARCGKRETRGQELGRCIGCGDWLCGRAQCSRPGYENLARRHSGRVCAACVRLREIVPQPGAGKGAGSGAGVEAVDRARYYLHEAGEELEQRLRKLSIELAERISGVVEERLAELGQRAGLESRAVTKELGAALEEALARGLARGAGDAAMSGRSLLGAAGVELRALRRSLLTIGLVLLVANAAVTVGLVLSLR